ncbi:hypothetical protein X777_10702 [Ooceraea biroi]|uniref:Tc1-like transposase DDE domain-containing protein n=1 Tax=Ooceraea biroi TaxID=2015173 RepID=A0A026W641_OOCBI|nr:hypothetical protein X777_10702 [Ooceraea biroi]
MLRNRMWFMHDGAPPHFSLAVRQFLNRKFANRWIGRGTQRPNHLWPARSPDLNPVDFFLWGQLKSLVYATPIQNEEDLRNRIIDGCERIRNTPGIFERVRQSMERRVEACIMAAGGHFSAVTVMLLFFFLVTIFFFVIIFLFGYYCFSFVSFAITQTVL